ncbi:MAG: ribosomal-processing cysteine protease Prp [Lachnospira eligens]
MTHITFLRTLKRDRFYSAGHAGYAESGSDIICSGYFSSDNQYY